MIKYKREKIAHICPASSGVDLTGCKIESPVDDVSENVLSRTELLPDADLDRARL